MAGKIGLERLGLAQGQQKQTVASFQRSWTRKQRGHTWGLPKNDLLPSNTSDILRVLGLHKSTEPGSLPS